MLAALFVMLAVAGAALARWTRWHPLLIAAGLGIATIPPALLLFAGFMSPAALPAAIVWGVIAAGPAAFGAFMGWLRRRSVERRVGRVSAPA